MTTQASSKRSRRVVGAGILVGAPMLMAAVVLFVPSQVGRPASEPPPLIGCPGSISILVVLALTWLVTAWLASRDLWSLDRTRLVRAMAVAGTLAFAIALVVAVSRLLDGQPRRVIAEDAGLTALGALIVALPLLLAWAVLTVKARPHSKPHQ